jgi:hypothetical protein
LHSGNNPLNTSLATIEQEGAALIQRAAGRAPAKVVALKTGMTERNVRSMRQREHQPRWINFIALAKECPDLRSAVLRWLSLESVVTPQEQAAMQAAMRAWSEAMDRKDGS